MLIIWYFSWCESHQSTSWLYLTPIFVPLISRLVWSIWHWLTTGWRSILVVWGRRVLGRSSATLVFIALTHGVRVLLHAPFTVCTITCKRRRRLLLHTRQQSKFESATRFVQDWFLDWFLLNNFWIYLMDPGPDQGPRQLGLGFSPEDIWLHLGQSGL